MIYIMKTIIIGGGPSGIAAALHLRQLTNNEIIILDANPQIGKKLSATGNGRCNITNINIKSENYFSRNFSDISSVITKYTPEKIREFLDDIGIPTVITEGGWVYPSSFSASNVNEIFKGQLEASGITVISNYLASKICKENNHFIVSSENPKQTIICDQIIIASGSKAYPQLGSHTEILQELEKFGHKIIPFLPALSPIVLKNNPFKSIQGVKIDACISVLKNGTKLGCTTQNIIFTEFGLNGPGVMNISHLINPLSSPSYILKINFIPLKVKNTIIETFYHQINKNIPYLNIFLSILPEKLSLFFFDFWNLPLKVFCNQIDPSLFMKHLHDLETYIVAVESIKSFNFSQACSGGIDLHEINIQTMESLKCKNLYFAGEALDVVGPCGGYNLNWAIASGLNAADGSSILV